MKEITILLTRYSDRISNFVYHVAGHGYTHASLSLGGGVYYSFNYRGFCEETLEKHRRRGVAHNLSCVLAVSDEAYLDIQTRIETFQQRRTEYHYNRLGVICCLLRIPFLWRQHYFCSQFVAEVLKQSTALPLAKRAQLYLPNQLCQELIASGQLIRLQGNPV